MKIAVVTPYFKEPNEILEQCHRSVAEQTVRCDHFLVADGFPNRITKSWKAMCFDLPNAHADNGNTPRVLGAISAFNLGYDAVAFLDADNWYRPDHIERMVGLHERTGSDVCTASRSMHRWDGSFMFDDDKNDGRTHVDTSGFFCTRSCRATIARWSLLPRELGPICDTVYFGSVQSSGLSRSHEIKPTFCFRTSYESDYRRLGEEFPPNVKKLAETDRPFEWFASLPAIERWQICRALGWPSSTRNKLKLRVEYALFVGKRKFGL